MRFWVCDFTKSNENSPKSAESTLDSAIPQNPESKIPNRRISHTKHQIHPRFCKVESKKFLLRFAFAKSRVFSLFKDLNNQRFHNSAESANLQNPPSILQTQNLKSFCYFLLLPKVESLIPLKTQIHQTTQFCRIHAKFHDSIESHTQNTNP